MKPGIHPTYRHVVFQDTSSGDTFLTRSTIDTADTITWTDGNEYPLAKVEISAFTHPFFTGQMKIVDTAGRVERFERRYGLAEHVLPADVLAAPVARPDAIRELMTPTAPTKKGEMGFHTGISSLKPKRTATQRRALVSTVR